MKIGVIGAGAWGTALANLLCDNNHEVVIYTLNDKIKEDINNNHKNSIVFDNLLSSALSASTDLKFCSQNKDMIVLAVPTIAIAEVVEEIIPYLSSNTIILNTAKGFDPNTNQTISACVKTILLNKNLSFPFASLIGPGFAQEVLDKMLTTCNAVSTDDNTSKIVQKCFSTPYFRVYRSDDEIGCEIAVALKNAIAIASGIVAGLGGGENAFAALITRGLAEMMRFGMYFGAKEKTFLGLCGVGDLVLTASSVKSRNYSFGYQIGKNNNVGELNSKLTIEGYRTVKVVYLTSKKENIDMPIIGAIYSILYQGATPSIALAELMKRSLKEEF